MENWAYNLDMLAQNNILDYDAPSFVMGQNPRYVGRPSYPPSPFITDVPLAPALNPRQIDGFEKQGIPSKNTGNDNIVKPDNWKKWLFGALAAGTIAFGLYKHKALAGFAKKQFNNVKNIDFGNIKQFVVDKAKAAGDFIKNIWNKVLNFFKNKKP